MPANTTANKKLIRRFYEEVWGKGNLAVTKEVFSIDYVRHDLRPTTALPGPEGQSKIAEDFRRAFPDLTIHVDLLVGEDDLVAARWTMEGTNLASWGGKEPTGKHAKFSGVNFFRFSKGKVIEIWNHRDDLGLMQQVGTSIYAGAVPSGDKPGT
jgi:steroid delta-isomerase-like uncharacterized protein